ncbi:aldehyde oxidase GLOX1-like [Abrus precatorius]|uniref:Aldehyde oxidase GLOX1-like n=1 Tax=Abrus precatorius TaxID=3816 RepID=A0A8B8KHC4_ABRPR|nr:aldehyde oxidase GLOX1-like [Abrus precatorius]
MSQLHKVLFILTLLFSVVAEAKSKKNKHKKPHAPKSFNPPQNISFIQVDPPALENKGDFEIYSTGHWELISENAGVSAMHINLLSTNKIIVFDAKVYRMSRIRLPDGVPCLPYKDFKTNEDKLDCFAHVVEYDIETNKVRPIKINEGDPWCSCGGVAPDGTFVNAGGFADGARSVRFMGPNCQDCGWREYDNVLSQDRWYATQQILPNGDFILVGGRKSFSYEFVPMEGLSSQKPFFFPFLYETSDFDENNLYPFVHLSTDGNLFIFANNRSILLNPNTHKIVRTFPVLPGGSRNYPASGMSALLPIDLNADTVNAEVIVCGGNIPDAFYFAETKKIFLPALQDCNRMIITDESPEWDSELMPSGRTMGDALVLPNGQLLFINGAQVGTAAWWDADSPNYTPVLYSPEKPKGLRFKVLKPSQIARMYHSTSAVLPSGKIWVSGSNTHDTYRDVDKFPTETRVEAFSPPYLDTDFDKYRPQINEDVSEKELSYGGIFETVFSVEDADGLTKNDIKVSMYSPPFTTHGFSMGQRLLFLRIEDLVADFEGFYRVRLVAPPSSVIAPPGYYLLFVVHRGLPGKAMWVHIQ